MKYSKSAIGLLTREYRSVLKKCLLINLGLFALGAIATPAMAETYEGHTGDSGALNIIDKTVEKTDAVIFQNNKSTSHGAGLYSKVTTAGTESGATFNGNVTFNDNEVLSTATSGSGAGAFVSGGNVSFLGANNSFTNNHMNATIDSSRQYKVGGGAVANQSYADEHNGTAIDATMVIGTANSTNTFSGNTSSTNGGAIMNRAVDTDGNATLTINGATTFESNTATMNGGAIYNIARDDEAAGHIAKLNLNNGTYTFTGNQATNRGGAVYNYGTAIIDNATFTGNTTTSLEYPSQGGAIYNAGDADYADTHGILTVSNTTFGDINDVTKGNSALQGGAIANDMNNGQKGEITLNNVNFYNNNAFADTDDSDGYASTLGGAIYNDGIMTVNGATELKGNTAEGYSAEGGAIYNSGTMTVNDAINFTSNTVKGLDNVGDGAHGGAVRNVSTLTFKDMASFSANKALNAGTKKGEGGALHNGGTATFEDGVSFDSNEAEYGAAIFNNGTVNLTDASFTNNKAGDEGGAIFTLQGTVNINAVNKDVVFSGNTANDQANDITNYLSTINLNAASGRTISMEGIDGHSSYKSYNRINLTGAGTVEVSEYIANQTVNVNNGELHLTTGVDNLHNSTVTVASGAIINTIDNVINDYSESINLADGAMVKGDINFIDGTADKYAASSGTIHYLVSHLMGAASNGNKAIQVAGEGSTIDISQAIFDSDTGMTFASSGSADGKIIVNGIAGGLEAAADASEDVSYIQYNLTGDEAINTAKEIKDNFVLNGDGVGADNKGVTLNADLGVANGADLALNNLKLDGSAALNNDERGTLRINDSKIGVKVNNAGILISDPTTYNDDITNSGTASFDADTINAGLNNTGTVSLLNGVKFGDSATITGNGVTNLVSGTTKFATAGTANSNTINVASGAGWSGIINGGTVNTQNGAIETTGLGSVSDGTNLYVDANLAGAGSIDAVTGGTIKSVKLANSAYGDTNAEVTLAGNYDTNVEVDGFSYYTKVEKTADGLKFSDKLVNTSGMNTAIQNRIQLKEGEAYGDSTKAYSVAAADDKFATQTALGLKADTAKLQTTTAGATDGYDINAKTLKVAGVDAVTVSGNQTLTNKTIDAESNTISNLGVANLASTSVLKIADVAAEGFNPTTLDDSKLATAGAIYTAVNGVINYKQNTWGSKELGYDTATTDAPTKLAALGFVAETETVGEEQVSRLGFLQAVKQNKASIDAYKTLNDARFENKTGVEGKFTVAESIQNRIQGAANGDAADEVIDANTKVYSVAGANEAIQAALSDDEQDIVANDITAHTATLSETSTTTGTPATALSVTATNTPDSKTATFTVSSDGVAVTGGFGADSLTLPDKVQTDAEGTETVTVNKITTSMINSDNNGADTLATAQAVYNALGKVDKLITKDDPTNPDTTYTFNGEEGASKNIVSGKYRGNLVAGTTVADDLIELDNVFGKMQDLDGTYLTAYNKADGTGNVAANLKSLNDAIVNRKITLSPYQDARGLDITRGIATIEDGTAANTAIVYTKAAADAIYAATEDWLKGVTGLNTANSKANALQFALKTINPDTNIAATSIAGALQELDDEKAGLATANQFTNTNDFTQGLKVSNGTDTTAADYAASTLTATADGLNISTGAKVNGALTATGDITAPNVTGTTSVITPKLTLNGKNLTASSYEANLVTVTPYNPSTDTDPDIAIAAGNNATVTTTKTLSDSLTDVVAYAGEVFKQKQDWMSQEFGYDTNTTDANTVLGASGAKYTDQNGDGKVGFADALIQLNGADTLAGSVKNSIKTLAERATYTPDATAVNTADATTINAAILANDKAIGKRTSLGSLNVAINTGTATDVASGLRAAGDAIGNMNFASAKIEGVKNATDLSTAVRALDQYINIDTAGWAEYKVLHADGTYSTPAADNIGDAVKFLARNGMNTTDDQTISGNKNFTGTTTLAKLAMGSTIVEGIDTTVKADSGNLVTSGAVSTALEPYAKTADVIATSALATYGTTVLDDTKNEVYTAKSIKGALDKAGTAIQDIDVQKGDAISVTVDDATRKATITYTDADTTYTQGNGVAISDSNAISVKLAAQNSGLAVDEAGLKVSGITDDNIASVSQSKITGLADDLAKKADTGLSNITEAGENKIKSLSTTAMENKIVTYNTGTNPAEKTVYSAASIKDALDKAGTALQANSALNGAMISSGSIAEGSLAEGVVAKLTKAANSVQGIKEGGENYITLDATTNKLIIGEIGVDNLEDAAFGAIAENGEKLVKSGVIYSKFAEYKVKDANADEFDVSDAGVLSVKKIDKSKINGLGTAAAADIKTSIGTAVADTADNVVVSEKAIRTALDLKLDAATLDAYKVKDVDDDGTILLNSENGKIKVGTIGLSNIKADAFGVIEANGTTLVKSGTIYSYFLDYAKLGAAANFSSLTLGTAAAGETLPQATAISKGSVLSLTDAADTYATTLATELTVQNTAKAVNGKIGTLTSLVADARVGGSATADAPTNLVDAINNLDTNLNNKINGVLNGFEDKPHTWTGDNRFTKKVVFDNGIDVTGTAEADAVKTDKLTLSSTSVEHIDDGQNVVAAGGGKADTLATTATVMKSAQNATFTAPTGDAAVASLGSAATIHDAIVNVGTVVDTNTKKIGNMTFTGPNVDTATDNLTSAVNQLDQAIGNIGTTITAAYAQNADNAPLASVSQAINNVATAAAKADGDLNFNQKFTTSDGKTVADDGSNKAADLTTAINNVAKNAEAAIENAVGDVRAEIHGDTGDHKEIKLGDKAEKVIVGSSYVDTSDPTKSETVITAGMGIDTVGREVEIAAVNDKSEVGADFDAKNEKVTVSAGNDENGKTTGIEIDNKGQSITMTSSDADHITTGMDISNKNGTRTVTLGMKTEDASGNELSHYTLEVDGEKKTTTIGSGDGKEVVIGEGTILADKSVMVGDPAGKVTAMYDTGIVAKENDNNQSTLGSTGLWVKKGSDEAGVSGTGMWASDGTKTANVSKTGLWVGEGTNSVSVGSTGVYVTDGTDHSHMGPAGIYTTKDVTAAGYVSGKEVVANEGFTLAGTRVTAIDTGATPVTGNGSAETLATTATVMASAENAKYTSTDNDGVVSGTTTLHEAITALDDAMGDMVLNTANKNLVDNTGAALDNATDALNALDGVVGNVKDLDVSKGNLHATNKDVASHLSALDARLGTIKAIDGGANGNLADADSDVATHFNSLDVAMGNRTNYKNNSGSNGYVAVNDGSKDLTTMISEVASNIGKADDIRSTNQISARQTVNANLSSLDAAIGNVDALSEELGATDLTSAINNLNTKVNESNGAFSKAINKLDMDQRKLRHDFEAGMAGQAALSALVPNAKASGNTQLAVGTGAYKGHTAAAVGGFHWFTDNLLFNAGVAWDNNEATGRMGITYSW